MLGDVHDKKATQPCSCGKLGTRECRCSEPDLRRYWTRISGPLLDRIDLRVEMQPLPFLEWMGGKDFSPESSAAVRARVMEAR